MQALKCSVGGREELAQVPNALQGHTAGQGMRWTFRRQLSSLALWRLSQIWVSWAKQLLGCIGSGQAEDKQDHPQSSGGHGYPKQIFEGLILLLQIFL